MNCEKCGAQLPEDTTLCPACGAENAAEPAVSQVMEEAEAALQEAANAMEEPVTIVPEQVAEVAESALQEAADAIEEPVTIVPEQVAEVAEDALERAADAMEQPQDAPQQEPERPQGRVNIVTPIYARAPEEYFKPGQPEEEPAAKAEQPAQLPTPLDYFLMQLVTGLPLIGLIVSIIWAADHKVTHRKNYALGNLLYQLVKLVVGLLVAAIVLSLLNLMLSPMTYNPYAGGFNGFNSFFY